MNHRVRLPEKGVIKIVNGTLTGAVLSSRKLTMFYFMDSISCVPCKYENIHMMEPLFNYAEGNEIDVIIFFSPKASKVPEVSQQLLGIQGDQPVYLDANEGFYELNPFIPPNPMFHKLLLDAEGNVVLVIDPLKNEKSWKVFTKTVKSVLKKEYGEKRSPR